MAEAIIVMSESDRAYAISDLRRKARRTALEAARAAPSLPVQLQLLAALLEAQAARLEKLVAALSEDFGKLSVACLSLSFLSIWVVELCNRG